MDHLIRRRIPACVRTILTDITPKEDELRDWTEPEPEPEPVTRDGISLPVGAAPEALLTPAGTGSADGARPSARLCGLCLSRPSCYTCPRCNIPYCGLPCYRSPAHSACSEEFYKECVSEELKCRSETEEEGRSRMQEILLRLRSSANADGGMENLLKDLVEETRGGVTEQDAEALQLLSRLAELQASGKEEHSEEILEILRKLREIEEGDEDSDDEDLALKLSGLNIDALTEEQLWNLLPSRDKDKFKELVRGDGAARLVEPWRPWWEEHEQNTKVLIEELQSGEERRSSSGNGTMDAEDRIRNEKESEDNQTEEVSEIQSKDVNTTKQQLSAATPPPRSSQSLKKQKKTPKSRNANSVKGSNSAAPPISAKVPPLHTISSSPSPLVQFSVVNALYGYAFSLCRFNGDISESALLLEFCRTVLETSESLGSARAFSSLSEALEGAVSAGRLDRDDPEAPVRTLGAVAHILTGRSKEDPVGYALSALSQLRSAFSEARASVTREEEEWRRKLFLAGKKCEFLQSWVKENADAVRSSARWTWREFSRRREERETMERERRGLEEGWRKGQGRGRALIEEID
ncbi:zinc finger HIT domain-containing protein 2 [Colossoma macropomum]|uniref:zinc finger HIT domain-containing protein 2 n=1 Tax=Colossoma macropomum TaxID=42526 RepID=UPI0018655E11|nr:zinc finger HIT domain-containing protein 2 [Colossoma macropomum]